MSLSYTVNDNANNSYNRLAVLLNNQRIAGEFCDIKIIVKNITLYAHSSIMINFSNYIKSHCLTKDTLCDSTSEKYSNFSMNSPLIVDINTNNRTANCIDCVKSILNFVYLNEVEVTTLHISHLIELCMFLNIDDVVPLFLNKITKSASTDFVKQKTSKEETNLSKPLNLDNEVKKSNATIFKSEIKKNTNFTIRAKNSQCKLHTCLRCDYQCYKPTSLLSHLRSSKFCQSEKTCSLCLMAFDSAKEVLAHLTRHDHPKPFFCTSCDQRFQSRTTLGQHIPKHSKETPFICPQCRKGFKWKHGLTSHLIIHSKEMKHLCDECGFSTAHAKTLRAHKLVHTGDLLRCPYPGCKHTSQRKENLKSHLSTHNKETPFVCEICGHKFSQSKNLKRHSRIHDPALSHHQCPHRNCDFKSSRTDKLREHVIRQHAGTSDTEKSHDVQLSNDFQETLVATGYFHSTVGSAITKSLPLGELKNNEELTLSFSNNILHIVPQNIYSNKTLNNSESNTYKSVGIDDITMKNFNHGNDELTIEPAISNNGAIQSFVIADGLLDILSSNVD